MSVPTIGQHADLEAEVERLKVLVRQLQGMRIVAGGVTGAGAVNYGDGFSVARTGVGVYNVTLRRPYPGQYARLFGSDQGAALVPYYTAPGPGIFTAHVVDLSGTHVDAFWSFLTVGRG
ncbi:MAG TPA: hypothetical protein VK631_15260 [Solirubrobacteraceae bacterium]|nr:hypothetical protein [Solirubrobacteraceae bacterium]